MTESARPLLKLVAGSEVIVIPVERRRRWSQRWEPSVTASVSRNTDKLVLLIGTDMRGKSSAPIDRILMVAQLDGGDCALIEWFSRLPQRETRITLLHVVPAPNEGLLGAMYSPRPLSERAALERMHPLGARLQSPPTYMVLTGDIDDCICSAAKETGADLIVAMRPRRGEHGVDHPDASKVFGRCGVPILTIPPALRRQPCPAERYASTPDAAHISDRPRLRIVRGAMFAVVLSCLWCALPTPTSAQSAPRSAEHPLRGIEIHAPSLPAVKPHEVEMDPDHIYTLGELIDIAESNNPATRAAWAAAKERAAIVGVARSELMPTIVGAALTRTFQEPILLNEHFQLQDVGLVKTMLRMHYTLFDFGARASEIEAAKAKLLEANFNFNSVHLQIIYEVARKYYELQNASGLREAAEANLRDFSAVAQAAEDRLKNGLATLPDVLEARAAAAKAEYDLQSAQRTEQVIFGNLATTLTASPRHPFKTQSLEELQIPDALPEPEEVAEQNALRQHPDILARLAAVQNATAELNHARSAYYPKLVFEGDGGWMRAWGQQEQLPSTYGHVKVYDARVTLSWTIFDGLRRESELARARAERDAAEAEVREKQDRIVDQVWKAYRDAETALQQRKAALVLLRAAMESYAAAREAYGYGVRNILDVLSAERELANARAADVSARTEVLNTLNDLADRTGGLLYDHTTGGRP